jgi:hypothetical protein
MMAAGMSLGKLCGTVDDMYAGANTSANTSMWGGAGDMMYYVNPAYQDHSWGAYLPETVPSPQPSVKIEDYKPLKGKELSLCSKHLWK